MAHRYWNQELAPSNSQALEMDMTLTLPELEAWVEREARRKEQEAASRKDGAK